MGFLQAIGIVLATLLAMECISWAMHKYLFHGPLWFIHKSHHQERSGFFEWNDVFSLLFWLGAGISLYGIIYFIFHDWFIHNRFKSFKTTNRYLLGIRRAHKIHHKSTEKNPSEEFGLLTASKKYFKKS